jgi:hypothetical protein
LHAAVRIGENQQHAFAAQLAQSQFTATVQSWQAKIRRGRAGLQAVALDLASSERSPKRLVAAEATRL